jgi:psiF repeat
MKDCNAQATAKNLKGDDRKSFMSTCLSGSTK